jgi:hypothetical protein
MKGLYKKRHELLVGIGLSMTTLKSAVEDIQICGDMEECKWIVEKDMAMANKKIGEIQEMLRKLEETLKLNKD